MAFASRDIKVSGRGWSLLELVTAAAIVLVLAAVGAGAWAMAARTADRARMASNMRSLGTAILQYAGEHAGRLPGPLWPGQVVEYDKSRPGRLVVDLAPYLGLPESPAPYVVQQLITRSHRAAAPGIALAELRVFVMNMRLSAPGEIVNPWGSLSARIPGNPLPLQAVLALPSQPGFWEADRTHPEVASAPWAAFTARRPPHGQPRLAWYFDGRVSR